MLRLAGIASTLFLTAAACGKVKPFNDAGGGGDDTIDADTSPDSGPPGDVTVTTRNHCGGYFFACTETPRTLVGGIDVFVIQPDGTLGDSGQTDGNGAITLTDVQPGAGVTAVYPTDGGEGYDIVTIIGVEPGDDLELGEVWTTQGVCCTSGTMTANWTAQTGVGINGYTVYHPYTNNGIGGEASSTMGLSLYSPYMPPTGDFQIIGYDIDGYPVRTNVVRNATYNFGQTVTFTGTWATPSLFTATVSGIPDDVETVYLGANSLLDNLRDYNSPYSFSDSFPGDATVTWTHPFPNDTDGTLVGASMYRGGNVGGQDLVARVDASATSSSQAANLLPWLGSSIVSGAGHLATWVQIGAQPYDGAVAYLSWFKDSGVPASPTGITAGSGGGDVRYNWTVILPPGVTTYAWPEVPEQLADYLPGDNDSINNSGIMLVDLSDTDGYDELRNTSEWKVTCPYCALRDGELTGRANVSYSDDGGQGDRRAADRAPWHRVEPAAPAPAKR